MSLYIKLFKYKKKINSLHAAKKTNRLFDDRRNVRIEDIDTQSEEWINIEGLEGLRVSRERVQSKARKKRNTAFTQACKRWLAFQFFSQKSFFIAKREYQRPEETRCPKKSEELQ